MTLASSVISIVLFQSFVAQVLIWKMLLLILMVAQRLTDKWSFTGLLPNYTSNIFSKRQSLTLNPLGPGKSELSPVSFFKRCVFIFTETKGDTYL